MRLCLFLLLGCTVLAPGHSLASSQEECQQKWLAAEKAHIVYGEGFDRGIPVVVVDELTWNSIDFATKSGLAATFECAVAGEGKALTKVQFRSNLTNKTLGEWSYGRLTVK